MSPSTTSVNNDQFINTLQAFLRSNWFKAPKFRAPVAPGLNGGGSTPDVASYILTHAIDPSLNKSISQAQNKQQPLPDTGESEGGISGLFSWADTFRNTVANIAADSLDPTSGAGFGDRITSALTHVAAGGANLIDKASPLATPLWAIDKATETLTGDDPFGDLAAKNKNIYGKDFLQKAGVKNPWLKYGLGFGLDVALDPLTYLPFTLPKKTIDFARGLDEIAAGVKTADQVTAELPKVYPRMQGPITTPQTIQNVVQPNLTEAVLGNTRVAAPLVRPPFRQFVEPRPEQINPRLASAQAVAENQASPFSRLAQSFINARTRVVHHGTKVPLPFALNKPEDVAIVNGNMIGPGLYLSGAGKGFAKEAYAGPTGEVHQFHLPPEEDIFDLAKPIEPAVLEQLREHVIQLRDAQQAAVNNATGAMTPERMAQLAEQIGGMEGTSSADFVRFWGNLITAGRLAKGAQSTGPVIPGAAQKQLDIYNQLLERIDTMARWRNTWKPGKTVAPPQFTPNWFNLFYKGLAGDPTFAAVVSNFFRDTKNVKAFKYPGGVVTKGTKHDAYVILDPQDYKNQIFPGQGEVYSKVRPEEIPDIEAVAEGLRKTGGRGLRGKEAGDRLRQANLASRGIVASKTGEVSMPAVQQVINRIARGEIPKVRDPVPAANGQAASIARTEVQKFERGIKGTAATPVDQVNLYNKIYDATAEMFKNPTKSTKARRAVAIGMLKTAEDLLIEHGIHPQNYDGIGLRLSDVLADIPAMGTSKQAVQALREFGIKPDRAMTLDKMSPIQQAAAHAVARRTMSSADIISGLHDQALKLRNMVIDENPHMRTIATYNDLSAKAKETAKALGLTDREAQIAFDVTSQTLRIDRLPTQVVARKYGPELAQSVKEHKVDIDYLLKQQKAQEKVLGESYHSLAKVVTGNRAIDSIGLMFFTWFGKKDVYRSAQNAIINAELNAENRAMLFRRMIKRTSPAERDPAWLHVTGRAISADPKVVELAGGMYNYLSHMFGSSGFGDLLMGETVAGRSQILMKDLNTQLKRLGVKGFEFTDQQVKDLAGNVRDYGPKGAGWTASWEAANPKDPASFLYNLDLATERVTKEAAMWDDFRARWGNSFKTSFYDTSLPHPRLEGMYFPKDIADQMARLDTTLQQGIWQLKGPWKYYGRALRAWKSGVTIYLPSHHIRNLIGDVNLMWWAGYNDPRAFIKARRIMHSQRTRYKTAINKGDWTAQDALLNKEAMEWASTMPTDEMLHLGRPFFLGNQRVSGVTAEQFYIAAHQHGLLLPYNRLEDLFGEEASQFLPGRLGRPLGGHVHDVASAAAEYREHFVRLAHFYAAVAKRSKTKGANDLDKIFDDAAAEVRKWHPDGRDMTRFEQNIRLVIPFYSWTRKVIPLLVQTAATRPAKLLAYPRAMYNLQGAVGIDSPSLEDPFPNDQLFPEWIRATGIGPIGDPTSNNPIASTFGEIGKHGTDLFGDQFGYTVVNPSNPFIDTYSQLLGMGPSEQPTGIFRGIGEMTTPFVRVPWELASGSKITGAPIGADPASYIAENIPIVAPISRVADIPSKKADRGQFDLEALLNILTAAGIHGTEPYIKEAEFELRENR